MSGSSQLTLREGPGQEDPVRGESPKKSASHLVTIYGKRAKPPSSNEPSQLKVKKKHKVSKRGKNTGKIAQGDGRTSGPPNPPVMNIPKMNNK